MIPSLRAPLLTLALLCSLVAAKPPVTAQEQTDVLWSYSPDNLVIKEGHKQIRQWRKGRDSLRQQALMEISTTPSHSAFAARSLTATTTSPPEPLGTEHSFAAGTMRGRWIENYLTSTSSQGGMVAGVRLDRTVYDPDQNMLYALTTEATLVEAKLVQMGSWKIRNQVVQIDKPSFTGIRTPEGGFRLVGIVQGTFKYSDDQGLTWTTSIGGASSNGKSTWTEALPNGQILALVRRASSPDQDVLIRSIDQGLSFQEIKSWPSEGASLVAGWVQNTIAQCYLLRLPPNCNAMEVYRYQGDSVARIATVNTDSRPVSFAGAVSGAMTRLYVSMSVNGTDFANGLVSRDGSVWSSLSGFNQDVQTVSPENPELVFSNAALHDYSDDAGATWSSYPNNDATIGWDPKHLKFYKVAGKWTLVAANDMGLCFNRDALNPMTWQYVDENHSFAILHGGISDDRTALTITCHQDPGTFELTRTGRDSMSAALIAAADGLRATTSQSGSSIWFRHYGLYFYHSFASFVHDPRTAAFSTPGTWYTPPFKGSTTPDEDAIYVSGQANLLKLTYDAATNQITQKNIPQDFQVLAGDVTYGVGVAKSDPARLYVATKNGQFFWSRDTGRTWTKTTYTGATPTAQWATWSQSAGIYIEVADSDPNLVFWGSGSGAAACLVSHDGGQTFTSTVTGLPSNEEIHNVSLSPDGKLAFSSNYFVYLARDNRWYDLRTASLPSAALPAANAVNYLPLQRKVRYFTWGAGVLDLEIGQNEIDDPVGPPTPDKCYQILSDDGKALRVISDSSGAVELAVANNTADQKWNFASHDGFYQITNLATNLVLEVANGSFEDSGAVDAGIWTNSDHQAWNLVSNGKGFGLLARHSVKALTHTAQIEQRLYGRAGQQWSFAASSDCQPVGVGAPKTPKPRLYLLPLGGSRYRILVPQERSFRVLVYDRTGQIVWQRAATNTVDLAGRPRGVYQVRIWGKHINTTQTLSRL